jgi:pyruvate/2-oxoglutarate dehydrogenase complex dihydrolipoamide acyltransferase (E2) component
MLELGVFGIDSNGLNAAVKLLILFLVVIWLALVYYTYADSRRRIADPMLIGCATAASLFPFVGTIVYMIVRPAEYLDDVRERELEMAAAEARISQLDHFLCPHCDSQVENDFLRCPSCLRKLKDKCVSCSRPLDPNWRICPYCEAEVVRAEPEPVVRRRRRRRVEDDVPVPAAAPAPQPRAEPEHTVEFSVESDTEQPEAEAMAEAAARAQAAAEARARRLAREEGT